MFKDMHVKCILCIVHAIIYDSAYTIDQVRHHVVLTVIASLLLRIRDKEVNIAHCVALCICLYVLCTCWVSGLFVLNFH